MKIIVFVVMFCVLYVVMKSLEIADASFEEEM